MSLWIVIFPFDVIKSRMQIQQIRMPMVSLLVRIAQDEGTTLIAGCWSCETIVELHTHTHTTILRLCGICPGKPG